MPEPWSRAELLRVARERFAVRTFRPGQLELIEAVLAGRDAFGIMPTGAGKSLTFQLPALLLPGSVLVVSPLIALMQDQLDKLAARDIQSAGLSSALRTQEEREVQAEIRAGEPDIVYVTPERLENPTYLDLLRSQRVSLLVVDEAHCVAQWGHDFRPAFLFVRDAIRALGRPPVLALTATATPDVVDEVLKQLDIAGALVVNTGLERENLSFEVRRAPRRGQKREILLELLGREDGVGIVYVATVRVAEELHTFLRAHGVAAGLYHGKLGSTQRAEAQRSFMADEFRVMVATNAFGLGIDKPDLRFVIHYNFPDSIETYYQEAGRAGRDGKQARAVLLYRYEDKNLQQYFLSGKYPRREESLRVVEALREAARGVRMSDLATFADTSLRRAKVIVAQLEGAGIVARRRERVELAREFASTEEFERLLRAYEERHRSDRERLDAMVRYGQSCLCRMQYIRQYFGEPAGAACGRCDSCRAPPKARGSERRARPARHHGNPDLEPADVALRAEPFTRGQRVRHRTFGVGEVLAVEHGKVSVAFASRGTRDLDPRYLRKMAQPVG